MSWVDVKQALERTDMVLIPVGSIEQHGPQNPLGADFYEALELGKMVGERTDIIVAPALLVGYAPYHMGFPGTLTLTSETFQRVLFEVSESLITHGLRKILFLNRHGGNNSDVGTVIHKINHETQATAINVGVGGPLHPSDASEEEFFDWHGGVSETSLLLYLTPHLVKMERAEKPDITLPDECWNILGKRKEYPELMNVFSAMLGVPSGTGKGGASDEISSNGLWTFNDPGEATTERGQKTAEAYVDRIVRFIEAWQAVSSKDE